MKRNSIAGGAAPADGLSDTSTTKRPSAYRTSADTRRRLMIAAEWLAANKGLGALSAREIATRAELRNNVSVQYHFGSITGLLHELVQLRMTELDIIRSKMIAAVSENGKACDLPTLVGLICLPHLVLARREGGHPTYAAFLCQYLASAYPAGFDWVMHGQDPLLSALNWTFEHLRVLLPDLPQDIFDRRVTSSSLLFLNVVQGLSPEELLDERLAETNPFVRDALRQSAAVLQAPTSP